MSMLRITCCAIGALLAVSAFASSDARAANIVINSEQRAAAAVITAKRLGAEVPAYFRGLTSLPKDMTERTLRVLEAAYSPAALRRANKWVVVSCPAGGTFKARLPRNSHLLEIDWAACRFDITGYQAIVTGPGQLTLCDDDLTPAVVSALNLGNTTRDLVLQTARNGEAPDPESQTSFNLRLAGLIPLGRPTVDYTFDGNFSHSLDGYFHFLGKTRLGTPGEVYRRDEHRITAQNAWVSGIFEHGDLGWQEDVRITAGTFTDWQKTGATPFEPERIDSHTLKGSGLRVRNSGDYIIGAEYFLISGSVNYTYPEFMGMSCANGGYTFKTNTPARFPSGFQSNESYDEGEFLLNGTALLRFSANADPSELGEMHIDLDVPNVGSFDYDGNGIYETGLPAAAQCVN
jgi:hypothetical protein